MVQPVKGGVTLKGTLAVYVPRKGEEARALIGEHVERYRDVYLAFSGGKESVVVAHLCDPWHDRVTLVWVNTGMYPAHMVEFVRGYLDRHRLIEITAPHPKGLWEVEGPPSDLLSVPHVIGLLKPRMTSTVHCCNRTKQQPFVSFARERHDALVIDGIRRDDNAAYSGVEAEAHVNVPGTTNTFLHPLWNWTREDVFGYVEEHHLELPIQYAAGVIDSMECAGCPAGLDRERVAFLDKHYPETAAAVRTLAQVNLEAVYEHTKSIEYAIAPNDTVFVTPF